MSVNAEAEAQALRVECPVCGAPVGVSCVDRRHPDGPPRFPHRDRMRALRTLELVEQAEQRERERLDRVRGALAAFGWQR